ncbi:AraC family transcriptional regulator [Paenibacillus sp. FSL R10-2734]|uniref:AraC family transcriptional regulator n=1 Tax=Paenibacillus sp. FSL R10-2734 TaxID=2954691 RepID=UPI0030DC1950
MGANKGGMNLSIQSSFRRANAICNRHVTKIQETGFSLTILYWGFMPAHFDNSLHRHSFFEACYVMDGEGSYYEHDREYDLVKGTAFLSTPGVWHQIRSTSGLTLCYVAFEIDESQTEPFFLEVYRQLAERGNSVVSGADSSSTGYLWQALIALCASSASTIPLALEKVAHSLLLSFPELHGLTLTEGESVQQPISPGSALFRQAKRFIDDNLGNELTLATVASHLHISSRHLTRLFQEYHSQSFVHYIQERRMQHASQLLLNDYVPIKDIALQCGFQSVHYFTRVFTRELGVAPAKFRRSQFSEGRSGKNHFPPNMS